MLTDLLDRSLLLRGLLDFAFPPLCLGCGKYTDSTTSVCDRCTARIDTFDRPLCLSCFEPLPEDRRCPICGEHGIPLYAYGNYAEPLKQIILQFKFHGVVLPAQLFARLLTERFDDEIAALGVRCLVPIPLHASREYHRGYNQAALLAEALGDRLNLEIATDLLQRTRRRRPQSRVKLAGRRGNVADVFDLLEPADSPTDIILVDDVVTSGSTVTEAARTLASGGYRTVAVIAIAHGV